MSKLNRIHIVSVILLFSISCNIFGPSSATPKLKSTNDGSTFRAISNVSKGHETVLTLTDGASLKIPEGSLPENTEITLSKAQMSDINPSLPPELYSVGSVYEINIGNHNLQKPAILEIPFDSESLQPDADHLTLSLFYFDAQSGAWKVAGGEVDIDRKIIITSITHASLWQPATVNWDAWIAALSKLLHLRLTSWKEGTSLLFQECPQSGSNIHVDESNSNRVIQGCIIQEKDGIAKVRVINVKSYFIEVRTLPATSEYPQQQLLGPGDTIEFEIDLSRPSPVTIVGEFTQKASEFVLAYILLDFLSLPGGVISSSDPQSVACLAEEAAAAAHYFNSAFALLQNDAAAAVEELFWLMVDPESQMILFGAVAKCGIIPVSEMGIFQRFLAMMKKIQIYSGGVSIIFTVVDEYANYLTGNSFSQIIFNWDKENTYKKTHDDSVSLTDMILIPAGEFMMGCDPDHNGGYACEPNELPLHPVYLDAYLIDKYEVTNLHFSQCVASKLCDVPKDFSYYNNPEYENYPVSGISWKNANKYCTWAGKRLPTEAEWEKAARGRTVRAFPWGDNDPNCDLVNYRGCRKGTTPVGSYPDGASPYGVMDMAGNVWEFVSDWYGGYSDSQYSNPTGPDSGWRRVIRGGSYYQWSLGEHIRVSNRDYAVDNVYASYFGFRCASSPLP